MFSLRRIAAETPQTMPRLTELENLFVAGTTKRPRRWRQPHDDPFWFGRRAAAGRKGRRGWRRGIAGARPARPALWLPRWRAAWPSRFPATGNCYRPSSLNWPRRIKFNQFVPKNRSVRLAKNFDEFRSETIDDFTVFHLKRFVSLLSFVAERFDNSRVKPIIARDEFPKTLAAPFEVIALILNPFLPVAATVNSNDVFGRPVGSKDALRLQKVLAHLFYLPAITPIRTRFD